MSEAAKPKADKHPLSLPHARTYTYAHTDPRIYLQFLYEHFVSAVSSSIQVLETIGSISLPMVSSLSARLSLSLTRSRSLSLSLSPLCHSTSTVVAYFLRIHFLIGAAGRCCCAHSGAACAERTTRTNGCCTGGVQAAGRLSGCRYAHQIHIFTPSVFVYLFKNVYLKCKHPD